MELKNLFSKEAQNTYSTVTGGIKKKIKPVVDVGSELVKQNVEAITPAVSQIKDTAQAFAEPIVKPIQQFQQKTEKIGKLNTFFSDAGITLDDIKALAEDEGLDPNEVITKFQKNGIKVQGMEELQAQEEAKKVEEANKPFQFDVAPEYDEVTALSRTAGMIPKWQNEQGDSLPKSILKLGVNAFPNALQVAGGIGDTGLSYMRNLDQGPIDAFTETAKAKIINPTISQAYGVADVAKEGYKKGVETPYSWVEGGEAKKRGAFGGVLGATEALTQKGTEFVVENPVSTAMMLQGVKNTKRGVDAVKTAGTEAMKGNIGKATAGLAKSTGIGLKENIYDPIKMGVTAPIKLGVGVTKLAGKGVSKGLEKMGVKSPISQEYVKARTEGGIEFDVESSPTLGKNITDKLFKKDNEILAQQSVFPKATKEKTTKARLDASKIALEGVKQLYEDKAKGIVKTDIRDMGGGVDGILEGLDYHGKKIGEITKNNPSVIDASDLVKLLKASLNAPFADLNPAMKSTVENIVKVFEKSKNKADIATLQEALSNIKSEIFDNRENIAKLYKTTTGRALNDFLKNIEERFNQTIESTTGDSVALKEAKTAYSKYKKIQKDLTDSYMVELRNQGKGITGTAGKVAGLYEVLSNPSLSGMFKAVALKQAGETMQYYKSRGGNYETLIRNLDRESITRGLSPKTKNNDSNNEPSGGNMDNKQSGIAPKPKTKGVKPKTKKK